MAPGVAVPAAVAAVIVFAVPLAVVAAPVAPVADVAGVVVAAVAAVPDAVVGTVAAAWPAAPAEGDGAVVSVPAWFDPQPAPSDVTMHRALHTLLLFCMKIALVVCAFPRACLGRALRSNELNNALTLTQSRTRKQANVKHNDKIYSL
jgi:hypothetical protein